MSNPEETKEFGLRGIIEGDIIIIGDYMVWIITKEDFTIKGFSQDQSISDIITKKISLEGRMTQGLISEEEDTL